MKYIVRIAETSYEVEVEDIQARPVIASVNGERFEVHPEQETKPNAFKVEKDFQIKEMPKPAINTTGNVKQLIAPLPGTIVEIFVKNGEQVEAGHVVLIIEAMKMKNSIRSTRSGKIADVLVAVGQTIAHKQALVRFE
ncbi:MAG TPA: biotin/lipoyl-containing protein [Anaerolineales bacterium]|nr:biotin/lipoyl-containing protein [Anaerolineales bacterium]